MIEFRSSTKIHKFSSYLILLSVLFLMILIAYSFFKIEINILPDKIKEIIALPVSGLALVFLSLFVGVFSYHNHNKLDFGKSTKISYFHDFFNFIFIISSVFCFALGVSAIILKLLDLGGQANNIVSPVNPSGSAINNTKPGFADLISASGFILAVVSAYYFWALARAEAEAKKLTNEMKNTIAQVIRVAELSEHRLNANSNSLSHLHHISLNATFNIIDTLKKHTLIIDSSADDKIIKRQIEKIQALQKVLYFIGLIGKPTEDGSVRVILNYYKENILTIKKKQKQEPKSESIIIEWEAITPLLESFMRQLRMMFPRKNEYSKDVWVLIEAICHDLDIDPDSL